MKRILLVAPVPLKFELTQDAAYLKLPFSKVKTFMAPLHIATIAALTPDEFEVDLWDDSVHGWIDDSTDLKDYDLVGITGYTAHLPRAKAIAQVFRKRGIPVAIGGAGISTIPQHYRDDFDILFLGEAELTWPQFLADWKKGSYRKVYRQVAGSVDLALSPPPRWGSIADQMPHYLLGGVQTSRGCPFACEFCDVSYLFGHRFRHKSIDQVLEEIATLEGLDIKNIVFCDDNFIGNPRYTKELLRELIPLNNSFQRPLGFGSESSINVADDEELLQLLVDANFSELCIGIESPNEESLKETNKLQNYRRNLIEDIKKIQSYGLSVRGSLIVGFDHDEKEIFDQVFQFGQEACISVPSIRVLMAPPGTKLSRRLRKEGRLLKTDTEGRYFGNAGTTNIIPKKMTRVELLSGYLYLIKKVYDWENFAVRIKGFISNIKRQPNVPKQERQSNSSLQFVHFLHSLDKNTREVILDIIQYTRKHAPFMMSRVVRHILRHHGYAVRHELRKAIQSQIDREKSGAFKLEIEQGKVRTPHQS